MNTALAGTDPVIFFESQKVYDQGELFESDGVPDGYDEIPLSEPSIKRTGTDLTIVTLGPALYTAAPRPPSFRNGSACPSSSSIFAPRIR